MLKEILRRSLVQAVKACRLTYNPLVVWSQMTAADTPDQKQIWLMSVDNVESDVLQNLGTKGLHNVTGKLIISAFNPVAFSQLQRTAFEIIEIIKRAYYEQRLLQMDVLNSPHGVGEPIEAWNRVDLLIDYTFNYCDS